MMKTKFKFLMVAAVLAVGFSSCSKDDEGSSLKGEETTMRISIPIPKTYATHTGTPAESNITSVSIYIFNNGTMLEKKLDFVAGNFTQTGNSWELTNPITITTGTKSIYVGVNLPAGTDLSTGVQPVITTTAAAISAANNFAMFSVNTNSNTSFTVDADPVNNDFSIQVERWASKIAVTKNITNAADSVASGATFSDLKFCVGNINTKIYPLQKIQSGLIIDPNWATFDSNGSADYDGGDFINNFVDNNSIDHTAFTPLNENGTATDAKVAKYAMENTSRDYKKGEVTYACVRASFIPKKVATYASSTLTLTDNTATVNPCYVVSTTAGETLYFRNGTEAANYAQDNSFSAAVQYTGGYCYYYVWLDSEIAGMTYPLLRNYFFDLTVKSIKSLGYSTPAPTDPDNPIPSNTDIEVTVNIMPWTFIQNNIDLSK